MSKLSPPTVIRAKVFNGGGNQGEAHDWYNLYLRAEYHERDNLPATHLLYATPKGYETSAQQQCVHVFLPRELFEIGDK